MITGNGHGMTTEIQKNFIPSLLVLSIQTIIIYNNYLKNCGKFIISKFDINKFSKIFILIKQKPTFIKNN
jgi:hypothetical protein